MTALKRYIVFALEEEYGLISGLLAHADSTEELFQLMDKALEEQVAYNDLSWEEIHAEDAPQHPNFDLLGQWGEIDFRFRSYRIFDTQNLEAKILHPKHQEMLDEFFKNPSDENFKALAYPSSHIEDFVFGIHRDKIWEAKLQHSEKHPPTPTSDFIKGLK